MSARKLWLQATIAAAALAGLLTGGFAGLTVYYLAVGGSVRVRAEMSGELPAQRRAAGERAPAGSLVALVAGMGVGFGLGLVGWRAVARRAGLEQAEIRSLFGRAAA
jgi:hypothetical protein